MDTDPSRQDKYRTEQVGCGILLALVLGFLAFWLAAGVFWRGPLYFLEIIRSVRQRP
jgi:hypothetical protein